HRLKNTLMVVVSIARQTMSAHPVPEEFVERFDGRLRALSNAHNLLDESHWESVDLAELVQKLLAPYSPAGSSRYRIEEGEPFAVPADLATSFGLVLHELATNAAKHGSLSL